MSVVEAPVRAIPVEIQIDLDRKHDFSCKTLARFFNQKAFNLNIEPEELKAAPKDFKLEFFTAGNIMDKMHTARFITHGIHEAFGENPANRTVFSIGPAPHKPRIS